MKNYLMNLACRGAGLGPWTGTQSVEHVRPGRNPSVINGHQAVEHMTGPFETDVPSPAGFEIPGESGEGAEGRMDRNQAVKATEAVTPWSSVEDRPENPGRMEVPRQRNEVTEMSDLQVTTKPMGPAVTGNQDMEIHTEVATLETSQTRRTSQGHGPDVVVASDKPKKQDAGDEPYPVKLPRPVVEPAIMFEKNRKGPKGDIKDAPSFIDRSIPSSSPAGGIENVLFRQDTPDYSTRRWTERPNVGNAQTVWFQKNELSHTLETGVKHSRKVSEHRMPETLEKTMPLVRPSADPSSPLVTAAVSGPQAAGPDERGRSTKSQQSVTVRIGRVEVRAIHEAGKTPPLRLPGSTPSRSGFNDYLSLRNYAYSEP